MSAGGRLSSCLQGALEQDLSEGQLQQRALPATGLSQGCTPPSHLPKGVQGQDRVGQGACRLTHPPAPLAFAPFQPGIAPWRGGCGRNSSPWHPHRC